MTNPETQKALCEPFLSGLISRLLFYKLQISGKFGQNIWKLWSNPKPGLISAQPAQQPVKNLLNFVKSSSPKLRQSTIEKIKAKRVKLEYESALNTKLGRGLIYPDLENGFHKYMLLGKLQCRQWLFNVKYQCKRLDVWCSIYVKMPIQRPHLRGNPVSAIWHCSSLSQFCKTAHSKHCAKPCEKKNSETHKHNDIVWCWEKLNPVVYFVIFSYSKS